MHRTLCASIVIYMLTLIPQAHAYTFFNAYDATITRLAADTYQFRISVDYNLDMKTKYGDMPAVGAFCGMSVGQPYGEFQSNFAPFSDKPGERVWYSDNWWRSDHFGYYPTSLPGTVFGYDFGYVGDLRGLSDTHFAAQATWAWVDVNTGDMQYETEIFEGDVSLSLPPSTHPSTVPEVSSMLLMAIGLAGIVVAGKGFAGGA